MSKTNPVTVSSWTLGDQCKFEERVAAAKAAGFEGIGLRAETYVDALAEGLHDEDILAILKKYGIAVTEVEYIMYFAPLEGVTDAVFRRIHHECFPGVSKYFIPFISPTQNLAKLPIIKKQSCFSLIAIYK